MGGAMLGITLQPTLQGYCWVLQANQYITTSNDGGGVL